MRWPPFTLYPPEASELNVVVEIPHAGLMVDPEAMATLAAPACALARDADLYVDELCDEAPSLGATVLVAHASRYVCDLNRSETDVDPLTVHGGCAQKSPHGLIWRMTTERAPALVRAPLSTQELERRLSTVYQPYHQRLAQTLSDKRRRFSNVILLSAHSMPSRGTAAQSGPRRVHADLVTGTRGCSTAAPEVVDCVERVARAHGLSVARDDPYAGGHTTRRYGRPSDGVHAVQIELSRGLYMDEETLFRRSEGFSSTRMLCRELVRALGTLSLNSSA